MVGSMMKTWERLAVLKVDDRYRVLLDKEVREILRVAPGDEVLAIPYSEGVLITSLKGKRFKTSLPGFRFREERHEASKYLFKKN
jgi:bifunctional DNA-binding transcriptional regulator/antitoxin component of YhaV-PrlF toxin-antitoxin module